MIWLKGDSVQWPIAVSYTHLIITNCILFPLINIVYNLNTYIFAAKLSKVIIVNYFLSHCYHHHHHHHHYSFHLFNV